MRYYSWYAEDAERMLARGLNKGDVARGLGCSMKRLNRLIRDVPEFAAVFEKREAAKKARRDKLLAQPKRPYTRRATPYCRCGDKAFSHDPSCRLCGRCGLVRKRRLT